MSRRDNTALRCPRCRMHGSICVCALIPEPRIETRTRLLLIIHRSEDRKSSNTGRLAVECLANSEVLVRGHLAQPSAPLSWDPATTQPILLYPAADAVPIERFRGRDVTLVVPDGNWRQASKVRNRVPGLRDVPVVSLPRDVPSSYRLRAEAHEEGLATLEAIARAMGVLEGPHVREALERPFRAMVERTLWSRGELGDEQVSAGIPDGAMKHDPRSGLARTRPVAPLAPRAPAK